ncbi:hypothetical protein [Bradyrhizobium sp.]|uniref:hypothetical protein n=1 Tax=Bradyrhizobium sp. TaxID=376 RepID=UPI003C621E6A
MATTVKKVTIPVSRAYRALFREALDVNQIRAATNGGFMLRAARFQQQIAAMLGRRVTTGQGAGRPPRQDTASAGPNRLQARPRRDGSHRRKSR